MNLTELDAPEMMLAGRRNRVVTPASQYADCCPRKVCRRLFTGFRHEDSAGSRGTGSRGNLLRAVQCSLMGHGAFPKSFRSQGHSLANEDRASVRYRAQPPHTGVTIAIWGSANKLKTKTCGSRTCKPNSVCRTSPAGRSFLWAPHYCGAQATYPEVVTHRAGTCSSRSQNSLPIWSCSVWGLPCPLHHCRGGALLPHLFTLTPASF